MKTGPLVTALGAAWVVALGLLVTPAATASPAACTVSLQPSVPSPQLVGQRIVWSAAAANCGASPVYQFKVADGHSRFAIVRDFSLDKAFAWAPMHEGSYAVAVAVKEGFDATSTVAAVAPDAVTSLVTGHNAVVTATLNPLVALYSAPACEHGFMHVRFRPAGVEHAEWTNTSKLRCQSHQSRNFIVAGMLANTTYEMVHRGGGGGDGDGGDDTPVTPLLFTTGAPPATVSIPVFTIRQAPAEGAEPDRPLIYNNLAARPAPNAVNLLVTDLDGRVVWYYDPLVSGLVGIAQPGSGLLPGGTVLLGGRDSHRPAGLNVLREIDLAGNPLRETNIDAVNAQLTARGQEIIYGFHHEVTRLPSGDLAALAWTQRTVMVGGTPTRYAGDMLIVLDSDLQVIWTWDAFDHLDVNRPPTLGEICSGAPCPLTGAVDWLHDNAIAWSPADGNLLISVRTQDWVIKIDYAHGNGDGHVIWRLGQDGDFAVISSDPSPWFSHQHYVHYLDDGTLTLFDNGNIRRAADPGANSRGQVWKLDEDALTATLLVNLDLGNYSGELGTADRMPNGNYVFDSGSQGQLFGQSIEMLPDGTKVYVQEAAARVYRSLRISTLYTGLMH